MTPIIGIDFGTTNSSIAFARQGYNDAVMAYNIGREQVPTSFIAAACNFRPAIPYEIEDASQRITPVVTL